MTIRRTHWAHLTVWGAAVLLAVPLLGAVLWGAWRLLFWGVVAAAPHHYGPAAGVTAPSAIPPGVETMVVAGWSSTPGASLTMVVGLGFLVLVCILLAAVVFGARRTDALAALEEAHVRGEVDDEEFARRRRALVPDRSDRTP
jgi:hypothetical protein